MASRNTSSPDHSNVFLGDAINIATRSVHTRLNKLILLRLPLAIPPRADGPSAYTQGMLHIAPLYITFESLWHAALHAHETDDQDLPSGSSTASPFPFHSHSHHGHEPSPGPRPSPRIYAILNQLFIPGLLRSARLRSDLRSLTGWSDDELQARLEEVATAPPPSRLGETVAHIRRAAERHPHVLLAYAWVLYMALFSGGRFIRATLESAGADGFWEDTATKGGGSRQQQKAKPKQAAATAAHGPLEFFHFPTAQDGEDLKHEFKQRLVEQGALLTESEREEVVREAICIFENLILVINQLDDVCHTKLDDLNSAGSAVGVGSPRPGGFRIRDSVIVTRERSYRAAKRSQPEASGSDDTDERSSASTAADSPASRTEEEVGADGARTEKQAASEKDVSRRTLSDSSSNADSDQAARLARAMRFDAKLAVPDRTTTPSATGSAKGGLVGGGSPDDVESPGTEVSPRKRSDSTLARGIQVAVSLGLAVVLAVAYSRG